MTENTEPTGEPVEVKQPQKESQTVASDATERKPAPKPITSLAELNALCQQKQKVEFDFNGSQCALEIRRLTPAEQSKIVEIVESVVPPIQKGRTPEEDRVDTFDATFRAKKAEAATKARSLALYWAVPAFREVKPDLRDPGEITNFIQGQLTEPILNVLWNATQQSGITGDVASLVNFT